MKNKIDLMLRSTLMTDFKRLQRHSNDPLQYFSSKLDCEVLARRLKPSEQVIALDANGSPVVRKKEPAMLAVRSRETYRLCPPEESDRSIFQAVGIVRPDSTIGEMIDELGDAASQIRCLLFKCTEAGMTIVYRVPKNITLPQWLAEARTNGCGGEPSGVELDAATAEFAS
jgi:hypothetical protein